MRCKVGDMAIVVGGNTEFLGWMVTITKASSIFQNYWLTDRSKLSEGPTIHFDDSTLMPLRPDLLRHETLTEILAPVHLTA